MKTAAKTATKNPRLISAVIPVYNRGDLVSRAVTSVLKQDLPSGWALELLVVDDGSTDDTPQVLEAMRHHAVEHTMKILTRRHGGTPGSARNHGVAHAAGELLAFLDSDDQWLPKKLLHQIPLHESGSAFSHTRERWIRHGREVSQSGKRFSRYRRSGDLLEDALVKCIIGPSTVMMSRTLWETTGGFRADLEIAEDYEYWLRLVTVTPVLYVDVPLTVKYAGHGDQLSEKYGMIEPFRIQGLLDLVRDQWFLRNRDEAAQALAERELARKALIHARGARKRGKHQEAEQFEALAHSRDRDSRFFDFPESLV